MAVSLRRARIALNLAAAAAAAARLPVRDATPRLHKRHAFAGAQANGLHPWPFAGIRSFDSELLGDLSRLRANSRFIARNTPHGIRFVRLYADNVIGDQGYTLRLQLADREAAREILDEWDLWCADHASPDGLNWIEVQRKIAISEPQSGEYLVRMLPGADNPYGFAVQVINPDLLDHTVNTPAGQSRPRVRMGIHVNPWGRPVAYPLWTSHPRDVQGTPNRSAVEIPAEHVRHGYEIIGEDQSRGLPWFAAVMREGNTFDGYVEATAVNARWASSKIGYLERTEAAIDADEDEAAEVYPLASLGAEPGTLGRIPDGYKLIKNEFEGPGESFDSFCTTMLMQMSAGLHTSHAALTGDLRHGNYGSHRIGKLIDNAAYAYHQGRYRRGFHEPVFFEWARWAFIAGRIRTRPEALFAKGVVKFQPPVFPWLDPESDMEAELGEIAGGVQTISGFAAKRGRSLREILEEKKQELELAAEIGVDLEAVYAAISGRAAAPRPTKPPTTTTA